MRREGVACRLRRKAREGIGAILLREGVRAVLLRERIRSVLLRERVEAGLLWLLGEWIRSTCTEGKTGAVWEDHRLRAERVTSDLWLKRLLRER